MTLFEKHMVDNHFGEYCSSSSSQNPMGVGTKQAGAVSICGTTALTPH